MRADGTWTVLIVAAESRNRAALTRCLAEDYRVLAAASGQAALALLATDEVDLVLCDHRLPDVTVETLREARVSHPEAIRILLTGQTDHRELIRSINEAAVYEVVAKPWQPDHLLLLVKRALESRELARRHRYLSRELKFADAVLRRQNTHMAKLLQDSYEFDKLVFASASMVGLCNLARRAATTDLPVLIQGESGTGKELMARAVHFFSPRKEQPFLAQSCSALRDEHLHSELFGHRRGAFEGALSDRLGLLPATDGGTVFLDEIATVSPSFQASLLRFLQEGEFRPLGAAEPRHCNVRIIAASNQPLEALVEQKKFRRDLYHRLRGFELNVPPLRERTEDIVVLAEHAARKYAGALHRSIAGISAEVLQRLKVHPFPGNVRELENEMHRMVASAGDGEFLSVKHMSPEFARLAPENRSVQEAAFLNGEGTLKEKVESLESQLVLQALAKHKWNYSRTARSLGLSRVGLANKIKRYRLGERDE